MIEDWTQTFPMRLLDLPPCQLGEGPLWDEKEQCFLQLDITGKRLYRLWWTTGKTASQELPQMAGCVCLTAGGKLAFGMEDGVYSETGARLNREIPIPGVRFNDGKPGPDGRFYLGTINKPGGGKLFCLGGDGILTPVLEDVRVSNGIDWSPDEQQVYYCDTPTQKIRRFAFDKKSGTFSGGQTAIEIPEELGHPDGLCADMEGMLWIALWGGGKVVRANPNTGELLGTVTFPVSNVSCPVFCGRELSELAVTTARAPDREEPLAGRTFVLKTPFHGRAPYRFRDGGTKEGTTK